LPVVAHLDRVIHEPARLKIVATLYLIKEADFLYLQKQTDLTKGNLSSHLAVCSLTKQGRASNLCHHFIVAG
jgi:Winged helix DNA-binding domain